MRYGVSWRTRHGSRWISFGPAGWAIIGPWVLMGWLIYWSSIGVIRLYVWIGKDLFRLFIWIVKGLFRGGRAAVRAIRQQRTASAPVRPGRHSL